MYMSYGSSTTLAGHPSPRRSSCPTAKGRVVHSGATCPRRSPTKVIESLQNFWCRTTDRDHRRDDPGQGKTGATASSSGPSRTTTRSRSASTPRAFRARRQRSRPPARTARSRSSSCKTLMIEYHAPAWARRPARSSRIEIASQTWIMLAAASVPAQPARWNWSGFPRHSWVLGSLTASRLSSPPCSADGRWPRQIRTGPTPILTSVEHSAGRWCCGVSSESRVVVTAQKGSGLNQGQATPTCSTSASSSTAADGYGRIDLGPSARHADPPRLHGRRRRDDSLFALTDGEGRFTRTARCPWSPATPRRRAPRRGSPPDRRSFSAIPHPSAKVGRATPTGTLDLVSFAGGLSRQRAGAHLSPRWL